MDKAAVIREFLGWAETNKGVALAWCDFEGACEMSPQSADELVDLFVASQERGAKLDAIIDGQLGGIPEMVANTPPEQASNNPMASATVLDVPPEVLQSVVGGWPWKKAPNAYATLNEHPEAFFISPTWTPTPETVRQWKEAWSERAKC